MPIVELTIAPALIQAVVNHFSYLSPNSSIFKNKAFLSSSCGHQAFSCFVLANCDITLVFLNYDVTDPDD